MPFRFCLRAFFSTLVMFVLVQVPASMALASDAKKATSVKVPSLKADLLDMKDPKKLLFKFEKYVEPSTNSSVVTRRYLTPSGEVVAEEKLQYEGTELKSLSLDHRQLDQSGNLEVSGKTLKFTYTKSGKTKTSEEELKGELVSADQIYTFIVRNWEKLMKGETLQIRLPVLDRLETVGFKFLKEKDADLNGTQMQVIKMKASSFVIAAIVDPVLFYFHPTEMGPEGRKIVQVVGRTVPKVKEGEKWKDLDAIMRFEY